MDDYLAQAGWLVMRDLRNELLSCSSPERGGKTHAKFVVLVVDHAGNEEEVDHPPDEADQNEVAQDLEEGAHRLAEVETVRGEDAEEEPEQVRDDDVLSVVADAGFDKLQLVRAERHGAVPSITSLNMVRRDPGARPSITMTLGATNRSKRAATEPTGAGRRCRSRRAGPSTTARDTLAMCRLSKESQSAPAPKKYWKITPIFSLSGSR